MAGSSPATWRTRRPLRVVAQRRLRPFERVAVVCARRAESALNAGYTVAGPDVRPGDPVRGEAARWLDRERAHRERGMAALWRAFRGQRDKGAWVKARRENPLFWYTYSGALWHMDGLVQRGGPDLAVEPLEMIERYTRANEPKGATK